LNSILTPCFCFPTTILLVDDNLPFMENLSLSLKSNLPLKLIENPKIALQEIMSNSDKIDLIKKSFLNNVDYSFDDENGVDKAIINMNIQKIHHEIYNPQRFLSISTVIADYNMPEMNGVELLDKIKDLFLKKVLLTGEADEKIAVMAFNEGIIDKYIKKSSDSMIKQVSDIINNSSIDFFRKISTPIISALVSSDNCILTEKDFFSFFEKILLANNIIEYYLIDKSGSYLMLNKKGHSYFLIIKTEDEINQLYEVACGNHANKNIKDALKRREKLPVLLTEKEHKLPINNWENFLYNFQVFKGIKNYWYTVIDDLKTDYLQKEKIFPYEKSEILR
jgi:CheY-like chemotaxis protein